MTWFKVDDSFYDHPKALAAGPAVALWLRAGCWCARQLTDGFVHRAVLPQVGGSPAMAKRLVEARAVPGGTGLWVPVDGGWLFHDWADYQPTKVSREAMSEAAKKRWESVPDPARSRAARKAAESRWSR